ncbi:methyl-accepting chemotaxis protein [Actinoplanes sp. CA-030573]|uniref:methyl-accepting chemotaxis protein n=1 Tax=Actinoplanes sp. CA-030573 TaxID=3239898 RepID=UPI003D8A1F72
MSHQLLALGLGGVLITAIVLLGVGAWESGRFAGHAGDEVAAQTRESLDRTVTDVTTLVKTVGSDVQGKVDQQMRSADVYLGQRGGARLATATSTWTATNQVSKAKKTVTLPQLKIEGEALTQDGDHSGATRFVERTKALVGGEVTVFQRMDDAGDLIRVDTTIKGNVGTYIPAVGADGKANAVAAAIKSGKGYRGVAQVVGTPFITGYDPIKDGAGKVIGALFAGVPQADALASLTSAIAVEKAGANGWTSVFSTAAADAGRVIASSIDGLPGQTVLDATDAGGAKYVQEIVTKAPTLGDGLWRTGYTLPGAENGKAGGTTVMVTFYKPFQWAIAVGGYHADANGAIDAVRSGRKDMLFSFVLAAVLLAVAGAGLAVFQARRISGRLRKLTDGLARLAHRDLTVSVDVRGTDEIAVAGQELNAAVAELRGVMTEVTSASHEVSAAAQQVAASGGALSSSADAAAARAGSVNVAAESVSSVVQTVAAGADEMGSSISEISSNAQDAAQAGRDGVALTAAAAGVITELRGSTSQIADVVRLIASIAEQTNLLALNATIEAARAGETGKGFAVVANEVKELAQETARATEDVTARVAAIEGDTTRAVSAIEAITARIAQVNDYQTAIAAAVEEQAATTAEMARNIAEVAAGSRDIAEGIGVVSGAVDGTRQTVSASHRSADELNATAGRLTDLVGRFTV